MAAAMAKMNAEDFSPVFPKGLFFDPDVKLLSAKVGVNRSGIDPFHGKPYQYAKEIKETSKDRVEWTEELGDKNWKMVDCFPSPEKLLVDMACSVCKQVAEPPIYLCESGHLICQNDLRNVVKCPFEKEAKCEKPFHTARYLFYEYLYNYAVMECKYKTKGCDALIRGAVIKQHEESCEFRRAKTSTPERPIVAIQSKPDVKKQTGIDNDVIQLLETWMDSLDPETKSKRFADAAKTKIVKVSGKEEDEDSVIEGFELRNTGSSQSKRVMNVKLSKKIRVKDEQLAAIDMKSEEADLPVQREVQPIPELAETVVEVPSSSKSAFSGFRFSQEDIAFVVENSGADLESFLFQIPSVKEKGVPEEIVMRELRRFQCVLEDSYVRKTRRRIPKPDP